MVEYQKTLVVIIGFAMFAVGAWLFGFEWGLLGLLVGVLLGLLLGSAIDYRLNRRGSKLDGGIKKPFSSPYMSFTLLRPGLKEDHYIPWRLRVVDSGFIANGAPLFMLSFGLPFLWMKRIPQQIFGNNNLSLIVWFALFLGSVFVFVRLLSSIWTGLMRFVFVVVQLMTKEEAKSFPLRADKEQVAAWPDSWQKKFS